MKNITFNHYPHLEGMHAPFSPSSSSWLRYDDNKALEFLSNKKAADRGTMLHAWAKETIDLGLKQIDNGQTLYAYINDAIGFRMKTEVILRYSDYFFGTADAICFRAGENRPILRIHDLKTGKVGKIESHIEQLEIYAALFCLEYKIKPADIDMELRVYKLNKVMCHTPDPEDIVAIMNKIVHLNKLIEKIDY